jgi:hypothetical protein
LIETIEPRFGSVQGGDAVTFSGSGFVTGNSKYRILIDGVECSVTSASTSSVRCTTGARTALVEPSIEIFIEGNGLVATNEKTFLYVFRWMDGADTWGGELAPMDGETIMIPVGFNLLVDCVRCPKLVAVLVNGGLIFAPDEDP